MVTPTPRSALLPRATTILLALAATLGGCQQQPATTRPVVATTPHKNPPERATSRPTMQPATQPAAEPQVELPKEPRKPKRPPLTWTKFMQAYDKDKDADIDSRWTGDKRLEIRTENVQKMLIDFRELPKAVRQPGPWNLQIDGQGIEITGRRGWILEMTRGDNGAWNITGPKPPRR